MERPDSVEDAASAIRQNLKNYYYIKQYLGDIIDQRLGIACYTHGALTANLLEPEQSSLVNMARLDTVLQFGHGLCRDFDHIFREARLSNYEDADAKVIDILAEVKAFEFLCTVGFTDIVKVQRSLDASTVDFTAKRAGQRYAVEVTRRRPSLSERKRPVYAERASTLRYADCEDAEGFEVAWTAQGLNTDRVEHELYDEVDGKHSQVRSFCASNPGVWRGLLFISGGRDYFVAGRFEDREWELTAGADFIEALQRVRQHLKNERRDSHIHHWVITRGRDLSKAIIYPDLP